MPHVINGIGTWYYGKKNKQQYMGVCRACGHQATLTSYDTRLWFVFVMIPIIPLRRKRIIEECSACTRHVAMPIADWNEAQRRADETLAAYRRSPANPELAKDAMAACVAFRNLPQFLELSPEIERQLGAHAPTLCLLSAVHDVFGRIDESERLLRAAHAIDDDDETCEALAGCLIRQRKPEEAEPLLQHIVEEGIPDRVDLLYQLAQGYQIKGRHDKALEAFAHCEKINPHITSDETYVRLRDESLKHSGTGTAVLPNEVIRKAKTAAGWRKFMKVAPVVTALLVIAYLGLAFVQGTRRKIYLVNGLHKTYTAKLNGKAHIIAPHSVTPIRIGEGDLKVEIEGAPQSIGPETVSVRTSFFGRPFSNHSFVINPDATAVIQRAKIFYVQRSGSGKFDGPEPDYSFHTGQCMYDFTGVNFPFETPPDQITTDSKSRDVTRVSLSLMTPQTLSEATILLFLADQLGPATVAQVAKRRLALEPEQSDYLTVLQGTMKPRETADFIRPALQTRPVQMEWHRVYQQVMGAAGLDEQVEKEYEAMLAKDAENNELIYLAGRASRDVEKMVSLYRKAAAHDPPNGYAHYSLSGYHMGNGEFREASEASAQAMKLLPEDAGVRYYGRKAFLANGELDKVLEMLAKEKSGPILASLQAYEEELYIAALRGRRDEAQKIIETVRGRMHDSDAHTISIQVRRLEAAVEYVTGNALKFAEIQRSLNEPHDRLAAYLTAGELDLAERELGKIKAQPGSALLPAATRDRQWDLMMYIALARAGRNDAAQRCLKPVVESLAKGDFEDRAFAAALDRKPTMPVERLLRLRCEPEEKLLIATALGLAEPSSRQACFALSEKLNYDKRFPHLLVNTVLNELGGR